MGITSLLLLSLFTKYFSECFKLKHCFAKKMPIQVNEKITSTVSLRLYFSLKYSKSTLYTILFNKKIKKSLYYQEYRMKKQ